MPEPNGTASPRRPLRCRHVLACVLGLLILAAFPILALGIAPGAGTRPTLANPPVATAPHSPAKTTDAAKASETARGPLTLVGLGDSVPAAGTCGCAGYVEQVGAQLRRLTNRAWVVHNDATGGWETSDVRDHLQEAPTRAHLAAADLVILQVGANDFELGDVDDPACLPPDTSTCFAPTLQDLHADLGEVIADIRAIDHRPDLHVAMLGYWNVTADGQVGQSLGSDFVTGSDALTRSVNQTIRDVATATGSIYIDTYTPLKGPSGQRDPTPDLLEDGDHPNAKGHSILATAVITGLERNGALLAGVLAGS